MSMRSRHPGQAGRTARRARRDGITLVEVIVAVTICAGALLSLGAFVGKFSHGVSDAQVRATAEQLATERIEIVRWHGRYVAVDTLAMTEGTIPGYPRFTRQTWVRRIGGMESDSVDYKLVTVRVINPVMRAPVRKTTIIAAF